VCVLRESVQYFIDTIFSMNAGLGFASRWLEKKASVTHEIGVAHQDMNSVSEMLSDKFLAPIPAPPAVAMLAICLPRPG